MNWVCVFGHRWAGCECARCGQKRDRDHEWVVVDCQKQCRRCGLHAGFSHEWVGCVCRVCQAQHHEWEEGVCLRCGTHCLHPKLSTVWDTRYFHRNGQPDQVCEVCHTRVSDQPAPQTA